MIKHTRTPNYLIIEGLVDHSQGYDENSFVIERADRTTVPFLLEILGENNVKINFDEEILDSRLLVFIKLYNYDGGLALKEIIVSDLQEENVDEDTEEEVETDIPEIDIIGGIIMINGLEQFKPGELRVFIKGYNLEQYSDYAYLEEMVPLEFDNQGLVITDIEYPFVVDTIYEVIVLYKKKKYTKIYIHEQPTIYYASIYHVVQACNELGLLIDTGKQTEFDLKLLIWRYSKLAFGIAGIVAIKYDSTKAIITEYVVKKVILHFITKAIRDINLTPSLAEKSLEKLQVRLGDFQHGGNPVETLTNQLLRTHKTLSGEVDDLEKMLPIYFSHLQATKTVENKNYKGLKVDRIQNFWEDEK